MEQYTRTDIERAKEKTVFDLLGLSRARRQKVRCMFHAEKSPSFVIYPDGSWYCFGCAEHGKDSIDFLTKQGFSFPEVMRHLLS